MVGQVVSDELKKLSTQIQPNYLRLKKITTQPNPPTKESKLIFVGWWVECTLESGWVHFRSK